MAILNSVKQPTFECTASDATAEHLAFMVIELFLNLLVGVNQDFVHLMVLHFPLVAFVIVPLLERSSLKDNGKLI